MTRKIVLWDKKRFFYHTVLPVVLSMMLFIILIFAVIVPYVEYHLINGKKEIIREQTLAALSVVDHFAQAARTGSMTPSEAQANAVRLIDALRYGVLLKDYFWITDTTPRMINHPYRKDLNGQDLSSFTDPEGKKLFMETVTATAATGEGFVHYQWQWMDDSTRIVPKISFVKRYRPWGWIIGTGIYIEDVREEIADIKQKLAMTMLGIAGFIALLMIYNVREQLQSEIKRAEAEQQLHYSRERYKTLVEASADGAMIVADNTCIYANPVVQNKYNIREMTPLSPDFSGFIAPHRRFDMERIKFWLQSDAQNMNLETQLITKDGMLMDVILSLSKGILANKESIIVTIKDISVGEKEPSALKRDHWLELSESFGIGYFRAQPGRRGKITSANTTTQRLLGFDSADDLYRTTILDLITDVDERKRFMRLLDENNMVINHKLRVLTYDRHLRYMSVTAITRRNVNGQPDYVEGILRDITEEQRCMDEKNELIAYLETPWRLWNQPVKQMAAPPEICSYLLPLAEAAALMTAKAVDHILVASAQGEYLGAFSETTFRRAFACRFINPQQPVYEVMQSPLVIVGADEPLSKAVRQMELHQSEYVVVRAQDGGISGILTKKQMAGFLFQSMRMNDLTKREWGRLEMIQEDRRALEQLIAILIDGGAPAKRLTRWYSELAGHITHQIAKWVIQEIGPPPSAFTMIALGSEGRYEQTLLTDQDNAIIYLETDTTKPSQMVRDYFLRFGSRMNRMLADAGYRLCKGEIMAGNPKWCQPLESWIQYFQQWLQNPEPQAILDTSIFFDFRSVYGDSTLSIRLRERLYELFDQHPAFFTHLARACMNYRIPVGMFNKLQSDSDSVGQLNIKSPIRVLAHIVRLYALYHRIHDTNTFQRIQSLHQRNALPSGMCREMHAAYEYLLHLQLQAQAAMLRRGEPLTHSIYLSDLTDLETDRLVSVFNRIAMFQTAIGRDFHLG